MLVADEISKLSMFPAQFTASECCRRNFLTLRHVSDASLQQLGMLQMKFTEIWRVADEIELQYAAYEIFRKVACFRRNLLQKSACCLLFYRRMIIKSCSSLTHLEGLILKQ